MADFVYTPIVPGTAPTGDDGDTTRAGAQKMDGGLQQIFASFDLDDTSNNVEVQTALTVVGSTSLSTMSTTGDAGFGLASPLANIHIKDTAGNALLFVEATANTPRLHLYSSGVNIVSGLRFGTGTGTAKFNIDVITAGGGVEGSAVNIAVYNENLSVNFKGDVDIDGAATVSATSATINSGSGSPEGVLTAPVGSTFTRTNGGANTSLYVKETGAGNTGWAAK